MGATAASIPAVLPSVKNALGPDALAAPPVLFSGLLLGVIVAALVRTRTSPTQLVAIGSGAQGLALLLAAFSVSPAWFIIAAGAAGFGFGFTESAGGVAAKAIATRTTAGAITGLITTTATFAAVTPLLVWWASDLLTTPWHILILPALLNLASGMLVVGLPTHPPEHVARGPRAASLHVPVIAVAVALYVGVESVLSGWSSAIPFELLAVDSSVAALGTSAFWILMALGRGLAGAALQADARPRTVLMVGSTAGTLALILASVLASPAPLLAVVMLALTVVFLAPSYGILLGGALDHVDAGAAPAVSSIIIASGACGGAVLPLSLVWVGIDPGDTATFIVCAIGIAGVCALAPIGFRLTSHRTRS